MADVEDVMNGLVAKCASAAYPNGTGNASVAGVDVAVYGGWPIASKLDAALLAGKVHVSVFPLDMERNTTRYQRVWEQVSVGAASITLTAVGNVVTVGGSMPSPFSPHNMAVLIAGKAYLYAVQATDTLTSIATALGSLIAADYPLTTTAGAVITVAGAGGIGAFGEPITCRVGTIGKSIREIGRQKRLFQITIWAPTPDTRKPLASALDAALRNTAFLTMPDGSAARVEYFDSPMTDNLSKSRLYRRDLRYFVEYATTEAFEAATVIVGRVNSDGGSNNDSTTDY